MIRLIITPTLNERGGHARCWEGLLYDVLKDNRSIVSASHIPFSKAAIELLKSGCMGEVEFRNVEDGPVQLRGVLEKMVETIPPDEITLQRKAKAPAG